MKKTLIIVLLIVVIGIVSAFFLRQKNPLENEIPMYGFSSYEQYTKQRTVEIAKVDNDFVSGIVQKKGSVKSAFADAMGLTWNYIAKGDFVTAMKRCNQAWLIDHNNFNTDWCYGVILGSQNKNIEAVPYFERALTNYSVSSEIYPNDYLPLRHDAGRLFAILSDEYLTKGDEVNTKKYSKKAIDLLVSVINDKSLPKEQIPNAESLLLSSYFNGGDYASARLTYDKLAKDYPILNSNSEFLEFDKDLKKKGY